MSKDAGKWAGLPLEFICEDFLFYDAQNCCVTHNKFLKAHWRAIITVVHIRFCFNKSKHNFSVRKFQSTLDAILNPVNAAMSIIQ
jgi:hypothetical protein